MKVESLVWMTTQMSDQAWSSGIMIKCDGVAMGVSVTWEATRMLLLAVDFMGMSEPAECCLHRTNFWLFFLKWLFDGHVHCKAGLTPCDLGWFLMLQLWRDEKQLWPQGVCSGQQWHQCSKWHKDEKMGSKKMQFWWARSAGGSDEWSAEVREVMGVREGVVMTLSWSKSVVVDCWLLIVVCLAVCLAVCCVLDRTWLLLCQWMDANVDESGESGLESEMDF